MRKLTKLLSALIVLVLATVFIVCGNPSSSSGGGNSNSPTYTTVAGGTYIDSSTNTGWIFYENYSVSEYRNSTTTPVSGLKWRIVNGNTVQIYQEYEEGMEVLIDAFTANSGFTQLTVNELVYIRQ